MAAPNIFATSVIYGKTAVLNPANTTSNVLLANAIDSGKVLRINSIIATNVDTSSNISTTVAINSAAAGSGTSTELALAIVVPVASSLVITEKQSGFYLEEDKSIVVTSGIASKIAYVVSYEEIS